jgi:hypothetical protein
MSGNNWAAAADSPSPGGAAEKPASDRGARVDDIGAAPATTTSQGENKYFAARQLMTATLA